MLPLLLPGIRHTRTPLVAGTLWLLFIWITVGPNLLVPSATGSILERRLHALLGAIDSGVTIAALAFVAALIGSLIPPISPRFVSFFRHKMYVPGISWLVQLPLIERLVRPLLPPGFWYPSPGDIIEETISKEAVGDANPTWDSLDSVTNKPYAFARHMRSKRGTLEHRVEHTEFGEELDDEGQQVITRQYETHNEVGHELVGNDVLEIAVQEALRTEYEQLSILLQINHASLFDEIDRLNSEIQLRRTIFTPLILLAVAMSVLSTPLLIILIAVPFALLLQSIETERQARLRVYTAVRHRVIESPTLAWISHLDAQLAASSPSQDKSPLPEEPDNPATPPQAG